MNDELVINLSDIRHVCISCSNCKTQLLMDMLDEDFKARPGSFLPPACPGCSMPYDTALRNGVDALRRAYRDLDAVSEQVRFRAGMEQKK